MLECPRHWLVAFTAALVPLAGAHAGEAPLAWDMLQSGSQRLIQHSNSFENAFSSPADGAQKYRRGVSPSIPFALLDDSLVGFPADNLGLIDENNTHEFFGVTDTVNGDPLSGEIQARWLFDISGASQLGLSIDMAAMGDFENADQFTWRASIDGAQAQVVFSSSVDESASQDYVLAGGSSYALDDPMLASGVVLNNQLQTMRAAIAGSGEELLLTLVAVTDGGSEAFAFQNLVVFEGYEGAGEEPEPVALQLIHAIQGATDTSPLVGEDVVVEAIVVGDFQSNGAADNGDLNGFFLQEEDADADGDVATSEGLFVYYPGGAVDVAVGDLVQVSGSVAEFNGQTQLTAGSVEVLASARPLPALSELTLPVAALADFEAYESMRVRFAQPLLISEYFNYDRFGEIVLALPLPGEPRPMTPTAVETPASPGYFQRSELNGLSRITLDDGRSSQNPDPALHPGGGEFSLENRFRGGDTLTEVTGVLDYRFGLYRVQPTRAASYSATNPRPGAAPEVGGSLKVAAFNVLNYFTTLDGQGPICGPAASLDCRGADNAGEFQRQRDKIIAALAKLDAAVVGLVELENNAAAIADLVAGLNAQLGAGRYAAVESGAAGADAIRVGFIYQPAQVSLRGEPALLDSGFDSDFLDDRNRPALAQTFADNKGGVFTAVVNHLKSKGSACDDIGDADLGDGQGNCNGTRSDAAAVLANWLAGDPTGSGDADFLILGDLNAYDREDPISALLAAGYQDQLARFGGEFVYSYVFDGQFGYLDHALANAALAAQVSGAATWHINADEPDILDYDTSFKKPAQAALYAADEFRSSDHDPVVVGLTLFVHPQRPEDCRLGAWRELRGKDGASFARQSDCVLSALPQR